MRSNRDLLVLPAALLAAALAGPQASPAAPLALTHVRIFDGERIAKGDTVIVDGGVIRAVGDGTLVKPGMIVVDGAGGTAMPGLIDSHTHAWGDALRQALIFGVTTELDMFTDQGYAATMRAEQAAGKEGGRADLFSAGTLATAPGGHGTEYGMPIPTLTEPAEAQAWVDARLAEGSDYIKIVLDDGHAYRLHIPTLKIETVAALIRAAHARGKLAVVHIGTLADARAAIDAGADALVHLFTDRAPDADFGRFVAAHHAFVVPTLSVLQSITGTPGGKTLAANSDLAPYLPAAARAELAKTFPPRSGMTISYASAVLALQQLRAAGVPILAGTDAPNPGTTHGASLHGESLPVAAGLPPAEALAAATSRPAERFRLADRGRIEVGRRADLVLVEGDPTADIRATRAIRRVWKGGVEVDRAAFRAEIARAEETAKQQAASPAPPGSESGLVSDFESGEAKANFGAGWAVTTDAIMGGTSTARFEVTTAGAGGSRGALRVSGAVAEAPRAWAGVMFSPGASPMAPANLSSKRELRFRVRGDGRKYAALLFAQSRGFVPSFKSFVAGPGWTEIVLPIADFDGLDGHDLLGIAFTAGAPAGAFAFELDDVEVR